MREGFEIRWIRRSDPECPMVEQIRCSIQWKDRAFLSPILTGSETEMKLQASLWFERDVKPQMEKENQITIQPVGVGRRFDFS